MASSTDPSATVDDEVRQPYEQYQAAETDEERHEIALGIRVLDKRRHAEIDADARTNDRSLPALLRRSRS